MEKWRIISYPTKDDPGCRIAIAVAEDGPVDYVAYVPAYTPKNPNARKRAKLIEAAPELLAAAKGILEWMPAPSPTPRSPVIERLKNAIEKAEGGSSG